MATELHFEDDDGEALLLLLRIAHLQFAEVPVSLDFDKLLQVAILCDMYDCVGLVKPWLSTWLSDEAVESPRKLIKMIGFSLPGCSAERNCLRVFPGSWSGGLDRMVRL